MMKIWCQSSAPAKANPKWAFYWELLNRRIQEVKRDDTQFEIHGIQFTHPLNDHSAYVRHLVESQIVEGAIRAEREGYDGFAISTALEPGYFVIRNVVDIPVAFLAENCFHVASMLADKFSIITWNKDLYLISSWLIKQYGLTEKYVPGDFFEMSEDESINAFKDTEPVVDMVRKIAKKAINQGAGILIPNCNILNMVLYSAGLKGIEGVPILDTTVVMVKAAEFLVDLERAGISRTKIGLYSRLSKEELDDVRDTFRVK